MGKHKQPVHHITVRELIDFLERFDNGRIVQAYEGEGGASINIVDSSNGRIVGEITTSPMGSLFR